MSGHTEKGTETEMGVRNTRGAVIKLFGVVCIILGALDSMLSWRGGFALASLPVFLLVAGTVLCLIGAARASVNG